MTNAQFLCDFLNILSHKSNCNRNKFTKSVIGIRIMRTIYEITFPFYLKMLFKFKISAF